MKLLQASVAFFILCDASALAQRNDWIIVPGKRIGPVTAVTARADLDRIFGKASVKDEPVDIGEGKREPGTVVFSGLRDATLAILWRDLRISTVTICYQQDFGPCRWHTESGVSLGTSVEKLESLNERALRIEPWTSDVGGNVVSWQGGNLAGLFGDLIRLTLNWREAASGPTPEQQKLAIEMDRQSVCCLSSDPPVRKLRPVITRMTLEFLK